MSSEPAEGSEVSGSVSEGGTFPMDVVEEEEAVAVDVPGPSNLGGGVDGAALQGGLQDQAEPPAAGHAEAPLPEPEEARPPDPPQLVPRPDPNPGHLRVVVQVFTTPAGTVYHRRRHCGKLRCARRVYAHDSCPECCDHFNGGLLRMEGGRFHCWLHMR